MGDKGYRGYKGDKGKEDAGYKKQIGYWESISGCKKAVDWQTVYSQPLSCPP
jgi:hypothetical protein